MARENLTGRIYGRLLVLDFDITSKRKAYWFCSCSCGKSTRVRSDALKAGQVKSCGCITKERLTTHGETGSRLYEAYQHMLVRCSNRVNCVSEFEDFVHFRDWSLDNGYSSGLHLCRNNDTGNYSCSNARWDTAKANAIEARAQKFVLINPVGEEIIGYNLRQFCKENDLSDTNLYKVLKGKRKHHKNWTVVSVGGTCSDF